MMAFPFLLQVVIHALHLALRSGRSCADLCVCVMTTSLPPANRGPDTRHHRAGGALAEGRLTSTLWLKGHLQRFPSNK